MQEYIAYWKNFSDFSSRTTRRGYWIPVLINAVLSGLLVRMELNSFQSIFSLLSFIPTLSVSVRRLRDAGHTWKWMFINFVPIIGWIWYIILVAQPSEPDDGTPVV